jgi:beta-galactosidase
VSAGRIARQTEKYLQNKVSINYYMVHGGTNFGFTAGANYNEEHDIQPDITSYDYDAPISEAGWVTPKYDSIRNVIKKYVEYPVPEAPAALPVIEIPPIKLTKVADMLAVIGAQKPVQNDTPLTFEQMKQGHGYVLYKRHFSQPISGTLEIEGLRDYALVYVNGVKAGELNRYFKHYTMDIDIPFNSTLEILVENMGRINYGANIIHNTKGIISPVRINGIIMEGEWEMYRAPMDKTPEPEQMDNAHVYNPDAAAHLKGKPVVYKGEFNLTETGDTFLDMEDWGKGIVFINGKNIGRYWHVGPQQTLYVPGVWLKKGRNEIVIFEQQNDKLQTAVRTTKVPVLTKLNVKMPQ